MLLALSDRSPSTAPKVHSRQVLGLDGGQHQRTDHGGFGLCALRQQEAHNLLTQAFELEEVLKDLAVARTRKVNRDGRAQGRFWTLGERNNSIGEKNGLVGIIGNQNHRLALVSAEARKFVLQVSAS